MKIAKAYHDDDSNDRDGHDDQDIVVHKVDEGSDAAVKAIARVEVQAGVADTLAHLRQQLLSLS